MEELGNITRARMCHFRPRLTPSTPRGLIVYVQMQNLDINKADRTKNIYTHLEYVIGRELSGYPGPPKKMSK